MFRIKSKISHCIKNKENLNLDKKRLSTDANINMTIVDVTIIQQKFKAIMIQLFL